MDREAFCCICISSPPSVLRKLISVHEDTSKLFTMVDLPKKINAITFQIFFADANQIGAANVYLGSIEGNISVLEEKNTEHDNDLTYWYNFGLSQNNLYILRIYGKSDYLLPDGREMELLFIEVIHYTLEDWTKDQLLLDILHCMNLQRPHGGINSNNIYIVNGRAKLANVKNNKKHNRRSSKYDVDSFCSIVDELFKTNAEEILIELSLLFESMLLSVNSEYVVNEKSSKHDVDSFCSIVDELFKTNAEEILIELSLLFESMLLSVNSEYVVNEKFLLNSVHHPVLLTPKQRRERRHLVHSIINGYLNNKIQCWKEKIPFYPRIRMEKIY